MSRSRTAVPYRPSSDDFGGDLFAEDDPFDSPRGSGPQRGLSDYLQWIRKRFWILALTTAVGCALGFYVHHNTPTQYQAVSTIEIDRQERSTTLDERDRELILSAGIYINTIAQKFVMPGPYRLLAEKPVFAQREDLIPEKFSWTPQEEIAISGLSSESIAGMMASWVSPIPREDSNLMDIVVTHTSPEVAQLVANGVLDAYLEDRERQGREEEEAVSGVVQETIKARGEEILDLGNRLALYEECLLIKAQIQAVDSEILELDKRYLEKWPPLIEARRKRETLAAQLLGELEQVKVMSETEREYWKQLPKEADPIVTVSTRAGLLESDRLSKEKTRDLMLQKDEEAEVGGTDFREFSIEKLAGLGYPVGPSIAKTFGAYAVAGIGSGLGIIFLLGFLDPSARTIADLEHLGVASVVGAIPTSPEASGKRNRKHRAKPMIIADDKSVVAESIRNLRAGLSFLGSRKERRTFLFTSCFPGEGKSWITANTAAAFAAQGERTLIIDLDLRKPMQHRIFNVERSPGLTDFFSEELPIQKVVYPLKNPNLYLLPAGTLSPNPSSLLSERNIGKLLETIPKGFDRILIDTPPTLPVRDALGPAKICDALIVVFQMAKTPTKALLRLSDVFEANGTPPAGLVANRLPKMKQKGYDYYYGYYGRAEYYGEPDSDS